MLSDTRIAWVDVARGLAIALVVLHHAIQRCVAAGAAGEWLWITNGLATMRMPLFFTAAGLFAVKWVLSDRRSWREMVNAKVLLFLWVYVLWVVLRYLWFVPLPSSDETPAPAVLLSRLWLPDGGWFIYVLALMFVLAKAAATFRVPPAVQVGLAVVASAVSADDAVATGNPGWDGLLRYTVFFLAAIHGRDLYLRAAMRISRPIGCGVVLVWVVAYAGAERLGVEEEWGVGLALRVAGVCAGVALAVSLSFSARLANLGRSTLPIYMTHQLLIIPIAGAAGRFYPLSSDPVLSVLSPVLLAAAVLAVTYWWGRRAGRFHLGWLYAQPRWFELPRPPRRESSRSGGTRDPGRLG
ncbi:MAG: acyltransferase [Nocardioides alkalitolerans]